MLAITVDQSLMGCLIKSNREQAHSYKESGFSSLLAKDGQISCWGGGGIVADSDCEAEYQETFTKVRVLLQTLEKL